MNKERLAEIQGYIMSDPLDGLDGWHLRLEARKLLRMVGELADAMGPRVDPTWERKHRRITSLQNQLQEQREWMLHCGGDLEGYVAKYGSASDPVHGGDGGEAIYRADLNALRQIEQELEALTGSGEVR